MEKPICSTILKKYINNSYDGIMEESKIEGIFDLKKIEGTSKRQEES
jgi:hypothetical protein